MAEINADSLTEFNIGLAGSKQKAWKVNFISFD